MSNNKNDQVIQAIIDLAKEDKDYCKAMYEALTVYLTDLGLLAEEIAS